MTHQNHQTNGASLEDCHTNFFALTDLCGIKWRKLSLGERPNASSDPLEDPVLRSYTKCLSVDILCVWRRVAAPKPEPDSSGILFDISLAGPGNQCSSVTHPPLSLAAAKELWIFWYGEEPDLSDLVDGELLKSEGGEQGSWESGISYECRALLFKALHNLIERCLLSKDVVRLGKWFVQPCTNSERIFGESSNHLSFSFAFFVHGDSTVCASMDLREHPAVMPLSTEYLADAAKLSTLNGGSSETKPKPVILAPFGLSATLTGQSVRSMDAATQRALDEWSAFYPLCNKDNVDLPPLVEVISGGVRMRYPSKYVLITDMDNHQTPVTTETNSGNVGAANSNFMKPPSSTTPVSKTKQKAASRLGVPISLFETSCNDLGNQASMHLIQTAATTLPERVWYDCIMNPMITSTTGNDKQDAKNNNFSDMQLPLWDMVDPLQKSTCTCTKCRKWSGSSGRASGCGQVGGRSSGSSSRGERTTRSVRVPFHKRPALSHSHRVGSGGSSSSGTSTAANSTNGAITSANHQSALSSCSANFASTSLSSATSNNLCSTVGRASSSLLSTTTGCGLPTADATAVIKYSEPINVATTNTPLLPTANQRNCNSSQFRASTHSTSESLAALPPSVESPGSAGPSPHPNSAQSQPTSVPPSEQQQSSSSPNALASTPNIQPPTPFEHADKNTPAPTPTDQHENKSNTASPYLGAGPTSCGDTAMSNVNGSGGHMALTSTASTIEQAIKRIETVQIGGNNNKNQFVLKRPVLNSCDYESISDDDNLPTHLLYDYSALLAWMNYPVKRFKGNDDLSPRKQRAIEQTRSKFRDIYAGQTHNKTNFAKSTNQSGGDNIMPEDQIKTEMMCDDNDTHTMMRLSDIKEENVDGDGDRNSKDDGNNLSDLFTNAGLQPSYNDLEKIFEDHSDENSMHDDSHIHVHTPPGSNKSNCGHEDGKRSMSSNHSHSGMLRPEELSQMFPTPPSLEHHPNSSPCEGVLSDHQIDISDTPNLGSPIDEPIEDWSFVFIPPTICKIVGSSKYAPLTNLPSQSLPPVTLPVNCVYKASWTKQQPAQSQMLHTNHNNINSSSSSICSSHQMQQMQQDKSQHMPQPQPSPSILQTLLPPSRPSSVSMLQQQQQQQLPMQIDSNMSCAGSMLMNNNVVGRPSPGPSNLNMGNGMSPIVQQQQSMMGFTNGQPMPLNQMQMQHSIGMRQQGMSPISPANPSGTSPYLPTAVMAGANSPLPYRRSLPPPPPYEVAVASPATSISSYHNKNFNCMEEPATPIVQRMPEANALLVNVLLYDTALNIFRDHNFDSCTLCVCNAGPKCVGNFRGSDSGVYVSLPGCSFNPSQGGLGNSGAMFDTSGAGYTDEDPISCRCGFSAVVNRRLAHRSGLFYEDEMEITGMADDPAMYKKKSLVSTILGRTGAKTDSGSASVGESDTLPHVMLDLLREQCGVIQSSFNSIHRAIRPSRNVTSAAKSTNPSTRFNILEYKDAHDVTSLALEQSRIAFEISIGGRMDIDVCGRTQKNGRAVHKWPFMRSSGPRSNQDIVRIMRSMQPLLQDALHKNCNTRLWDAPYTVTGPLTWRQFHRMAGRGIGQCEPLPIPPIIVGHEKDWLSISPYSLHYWDRLLLEPYSYSRDIAYLVIAPDNDFVIPRVKMYFKELSTTYEMCKLGRHTPIKGWDGILRVGKHLHNPNPLPGTEGLEEWFSSLGDSRLTEQLRLYAQACINHLAPYLSKIPSDKTLLDPPESAYGSSSVHRDRPLPSPMPPPSTPESSHNINAEKAPSTPKSAEDADSQRDSLNNSASAPNSEPLGAMDDEPNTPSIVIYIVEPFTCGSDSTELQRIACLALLRCYSNILTAIPESIRSNLNFQIISQESIFELGRSRPRFKFSDEMRSLALSVFSQCRRYLTHSINVKSLTGFGTAANMEMFLKNKDEKNRAPYKLYTPPYILGAPHEKSENTESFGTASVEQRCSVMYCSYCLSEDQSWLLAVATDDRGELLESITINIDVPNRRRRRKASACRMGLQKLMDFILGVISQTVQPWRLVVGRIGRIGYSELKSWSWLLSRQNLLKASKHLKEICKQCSLMYPHAVPCILSACLVNLEPDSNLRVMPDQFTPDERFSQISMQSPLSTPRDVTCTHILVFPTSAISQSSLTAFQEAHINAFDLGDDDIFSGLEEDEAIDDDMNGIGDIIFGEGDWNSDDMQMQQQSPKRNSHPGSPNGMEDNRNRQSPGMGGSSCGANRNGNAQDNEEVGTLLQQPLALGYLVSTAPTGRMPSWFWSACPHLENVCPVFLKTALILHSPCILQNNDDILQKQSSAPEHPLDSIFTADVLRYVLEGYNVLSWLAMDSNTHDRLSCLPINVQVLMQLYHMMAAMA